ncbi:hypothetical protein TNIN_77671 [Trichonephila inaurata madagascariensis]|uniref:Uncharacterized protein n=1 Tax=Trichonephila inaurata madagascariensis TaxID=2747483 RepID=A0A8X6XVM7_9ARAC|nr:hypothetical protein TNIN_77671 [Trichonephila inaurata madagascariensis]
MLPLISGREEMPLPRTGALSPHQSIKSTRGEALARKSGVLGAILGLDSHPGKQDSRDRENLKTVPDFSQNCPIECRV